MVYKIEYLGTALDRLRKLDRQIARRVLDYLDDLTTLDGPRSRGKTLSGDLATLWRYQIGDYRVLCELGESELVILALEDSHRSWVHD